MGTVKQSCLKKSASAGPGCTFLSSAVLHGSSDSLPVMITILYDLVCFLEEQGLVSEQQNELALDCAADLVSFNVLRLEPRMRG